MARILLLMTLLVALAACAQAPRSDGPAWERDDPARRVYGGGV